MQKYIDLALGENRRIFAISDIHGDLGLLKRLLSSLDIGPDDVLVYIGDYINRGPQSADTVDFMMEQAQKKNTYVLKGNIERLGEWYLRRGDPAEIVAHFNDHRENLFKDWAKRLGIEKVDISNFVRVRELLSKHFAAQAEFLRDLPLGLETEDFIFVHSGLADKENWRDSSEQSILKNDPYIRTGVNRTGKWVVVGHMPVWNIPESKNTNNPTVLAQWHKVAIDGGCRVKNFSQLNALIIEKDSEGIHFSYAFADDSPIIVASEDYSSKLDLGFFKDSWPDYRLELLVAEQDFSLCRRTISGEVGYVKNEHIEKDENGYYYKKSSCSSILSVSSGESLYLLDPDCGSYSFVKKLSGEIGWVKKTAIFSQ